MRTPQRNSYGGAASQNKDHLDMGTEATRRDSALEDSKLKTPTPNRFVKRSNSMAMGDGDTPTPTRSKGLKPPTYNSAMKNKEPSEAENKSDYEPPKHLATPTRHCHRRQLSVSSGLKEPTDITFN